MNGFRVHCTTYAVALLVLALSAAVGQADELQYGWKPQQEFAYQVDITADLNSAKESLKGVVTFTGKANLNEMLRVSYQGGLTKKRQAKPSTNSGGSAAPGRRGPSRGPRGFGGPGRGGPPRPGGPSIFSNPFSGLTQTTNELTLSSQGELNSIRGSSQLPYLLGHLSILFFEPLPATGQKAWTVENGVSITEGGGRSSRPPFFRPTPSATPEKRTAASETTSFTIESATAQFVVVAKTYALNMPAGEDSDTSFEIDGTGKWTFNRALQVPESLDFNQKLIVRDGNATVTIPMTVKYKRLSADELAAHHKQRDEMLAARKKQLEDRKKAGQSGLPAEQKQEILANLNSDKKQVITNQMVRLKIMKPHPDDKDVALLIQKYINDSHRPLRVMAQAAWGRWKVLVEEPASAPAAASGDNPFAPAEEVAKLRTWKDSTGKFSIQATFVSLDGDALKIKREDGREVTVPLSRLSQADQDYAKRIAK